jgi:hypothetical protein
MNSEQFNQQWEKGEIERHPAVSTRKVVDPHSVIDPDSSMGDHHRTEEDYRQLMLSGQAKPIEVSQYGKGYVLDGDGHHRLKAAQQLDLPIAVNVTGQYVGTGQAQAGKEFENAEETMRTSPEFDHFDHNTPARDNAADSAAREAYKARVSNAIGKTAIDSSAREQAAVARAQAVEHVRQSLGATAAGHSDLAQASRGEQAAQPHANEWSRHQANGR